MSRKEIEPILSLIFPEKGLVEWILSFDDYQFDLIRRVLNMLEETTQEGYHCFQCNKNGHPKTQVSLFDPDYRGLMVTFCHPYHDLEIPISMAFYLSFGYGNETPNVFRLKSGGWEWFQEPLNEVYTILEDWISKNL